MQVQCKLPIVHIESRIRLGEKVVKMYRTRFYNALYMYISRTSFLSLDFYLGICFVPRLPQEKFAFLFPFAKPE